jgi:cytochrome c
LSDADIEKMVKWVLASAASSAPAPAPTPAAAAPAPVADEKKEAAPAAEAKPKKKKKRASHVAASHGHGKAEVLAWSTDEQVRDLMTKQDCFGCHQGTNRNGDPDPTAPWPSFKKIEERYKKNADVAALVKKVKAGEGALRFGAIPHPAYEHLPAEAVEATVRYTLDGKAAQGAPKAADLSAMGAEEWMKTRSDCFSCHQVTQKVVGPSYQDVAKKYTDKDVAMLVKKVKNGGSGVWGNVPMTAHASAPDDMIEKSVRWVLSQK